MERLLELLGPAFEAYRRLSRQERQAVVLGAAALGVLLVLGVVWWVRAGFSAREQRIARARGDLVKVLEKRAVYDAAKKKREALGERVGANYANLRQTIPKMGEAAGIAANINRIDDISARGGSGEFREEVFKVEVQKASFAKVFDFLKKVEAAGELVYVRNIEIRRRFDSVDLCDANLQIATLKRGETP